MSRGHNRRAPAVSRAVIHDAENRVSCTRLEKRRDGVPRATALSRTLSTRPGQLHDVDWIQRWTGSVEFKHNARPG